MDALDKELIKQLKKDYRGVSLNNARTHKVLNSGPNVTFKRREIVSPDQVMKMNNDKQGK